MGKAKTSNGELNLINLTLGKKIRSLRGERKMKILDLAEMADLTSSMISQIERGLISPSIASLKKICDSLNVPLSYLFEEAEEDNAVAVRGTEQTVFGNTHAGIQMIDPEIYLKMMPSVNLLGASPVVHKENRKFLSPGEGVRFYLLNPNLAGPIELIYNEYDPGASTGGEKYWHPGSECGLILTGELVVEIKDAIYVLKEGDSITFNSSDPHAKRNVTDKMCTSVWANVPPWF